MNKDDLLVIIYRVANKYKNVSKELKIIVGKVMVGEIQLKSKER